MKKYTNMLDNLLKINSQRKIIEDFYFLGNLIKHQLNIQEDRLYLMLK